jgi:hypothetical protein
VEDKKNQKLKVAFIYPEYFAQANEQPGINNKVPTSVSENVENVRNKLLQAVVEPEGLGINNPEKLLAELYALRKKYDSVVEYTVHLTAERDTIIQQLELAQRELAKEKGAKKKADTTSTTNKPKQDKVVQQQVSQIKSTHILCSILSIIQLTLFLHYIGIFVIYCSCFCIHLFLIWKISLIKYLLLFCCCS